METVDTLVCARWIATVDPDAVLADHALAIRGGRIVAVLPRAEAQARYAPLERVDRPHHLCTPGLVNAHTHAAMTLLRGLADGLPLEAWLKQGIWPLERRWVGTEFVRDGTDLAIAEMLAAGITCFGDMYAFPEVAAERAVEAGMRCVAGLVIAESPTAWAGHVDEYFAKSLDLHDAFRDHPLVSTSFVAHGATGLEGATLERLRVLVDQLDSPLVMHLHETAGEIDACRRRHGATPVARLARLGLASPSLVAVHAVRFGAEDIELAARTGLHVVHCPTANLKLGSGVAPVPALLAAGVNVALGSDGAASANDLDLVREMRLASLLAAGTSGDASAVAPGLALRMATLAGAEALGIADRTGSLTPGKWADVTCFDLGRLPAVPVADPVAALVGSGGRDFVTDVWVAGRRALSGGRLARLDAADVVTRATGWRTRMLADHTGPTRE